MVIGEIKSAFEILGKVFELINISKQKRGKYFQEEIAPHFDQFEKLHESYLESFSRYKEKIIKAEDTNWIRSLQNDLENDNLFSGNVRAKIVRFVEELPNIDEKFKPFCDNICNYVMDAQLVEPLAKPLDDIHPVLVQHWRRSFSQALALISDENWVTILDPDAARPLLNSKEITQELEHMTQKYSFGRKVSKRDAVKRAAALDALNSVVTDMQNQYDRVCESYAKLKSELMK